MQNYFHIHIAKAVETAYENDKFREFASFDIKSPDREAALEKLREVRKQFPLEEGFKVTLTEWRWRLVEETQ